MPWINPPSGFFGMFYVVTEPQTDPEPLDNMHIWVGVCAWVFFFSRDFTVSSSVVLTNTNRSKLRGNQRTGAELVIGRSRSRSPVKEAVGTSRLERGGGSSRGWGAGAHWRLMRTDGSCYTETQAVIVNTLRCVWRCTWTMAGSWGKEHVGLGGSHTVRSLMSLPLKMMYSKVSSRGGIGLSVGRSSVPKERTNKEEVAHSISITQIYFIHRLRLTTTVYQSTTATNTLFSFITLQFYHI